MLKKKSQKNILNNRSKLTNYTIILNNKSSISVCQNISCDGYFIMADSLKSLGKRDFAKCNKIGVVKLQELCEKIQEALKVKIIDIV